MIWVQILNLEFSTSFARAWIDTALLVSIKLVLFIHNVFEELIVLRIILLLSSCTVRPIVFKLTSAQIIHAIQVVVVPAKLIVAILIHLLH